MRTSVGDIELEVEVRGVGEPVLLIHGFPLTGELWDEVAARLEGEFRLIIPDLRGHGASGVSAEASMARFAEDLAALLDAVGEARPVVLVGMSMGGYIALEFVRRFPDRVRGLALVGTRAGADAPEVARGRYDTAARALTEGSAAVADGMVERLFGPTAPESLREQWRRIMAAAPPQGVAAALRAMAERPDSRDTLRQITRPVLVVVGADDAITPASEARAMAEAAPDARLRVISGAGHMTPVERPDEVAEALGAFVRSLDERPAPRSRSRAGRRNPSH